MRWLSAVSCACAVMMLRPTPAMLVSLRLGVDGPGRRLRFSWMTGRIPMSVAVLSVAVGLVLVFGVAHLIVTMTAIGVCWTVWRLWDNGRVDKKRLNNRNDVAEAVEAIAAELAGGMLPVHALRDVAEDFELLEPAATAAEVGSYVGDAMRTSSAAPGAEQLVDLAAAWDIAERSGAPMARVLERLAESIRDERQVLREIAAGVGPAKATSRLMAVLPIFGLGLGAGMGANPLDTLFNTFIGSILLAAGCALSAIGVMWVDRIARRAGRF